MIEDCQSNPQLHLVNEFPNPVILSRESENDYFNGIVSLTNQTKNYVIFKVYFSQKTIFSAYPSMHFIAPLSSIDINLKYLEKTLDSRLSNKPSKSLIAIHQMERVINSKEEVREIFNMKKQEEDKTASQEITIIIQISKTLKTAYPSINSGSFENTIGNEDINCDNLPIALAIEKMQGINANYKAGIESKQKTIAIYESQMENLARNKLLFQSKNKALMKTEEGEKDKKTKSVSNTLLLIYLLLAFILGGYLAKIKNAFFPK